MQQREQPKFINVYTHQRFVDNRPVVLTWQTEPMQNDIMIAGDIVARIFASTSGSDWVVKLIDVYPENYRESPQLAGLQLMVASEVLRSPFPE